MTRVKLLPTGGTQCHYLHQPPWHVLRPQPLCRYEVRYVGAVGIWSRLRLFWAQPLAWLYAPAPVIWTVIQTEAVTIGLIICSSSCSMDCDPDWGFHEHTNDLMCPSTRVMDRDPDWGCFERTNDLIICPSHQYDDVVEASSSLVYHNCLNRKVKYQSRKI